MHLQNLWVLLVSEPDGAGETQLETCVYVLYCASFVPPSMSSRSSNKWQNKTFFRSDSDLWGLFGIVEPK